MLEVNFIIRKKKKINKKIKNKNKNKRERDLPLIARTKPFFVVLDLLINSKKK
jgi:hypothetical protein